jgi:Mn2+/Fe2+ NRAMP family transporter
VRSIAVAGLVSVLLALSATTARACSCRDRTAAEIVAGADVAIVGTVTEVKRTGPGQDATVIATVTVSRIIKGRIHRQIQLRTRATTAACGVEFMEGMIVRIAADKLSDGLNTNQCMILRGPIPAE